jgi:hypothetical protein
LSGIDANLANWANRSSGMPWIVRVRDGRSGKTYTVEGYVSSEVNVSAGDSMKWGLNAVNTLDV